MTELFQLGAKPFHEGDEHVADEFALVHAPLAYGGAHERPAPAQSGSEHLVPVVPGMQEYQPGGLTSPAKKPDHELSNRELAGHALRGLGRAALSLFGRNSAPSAPPPQAESLPAYSGWTAAGHEDTFPRAPLPPRQDYPRTPADFGQPGSWSQGHF